MALLEIEGLTAGYGRARVLEALSMRAVEGSVVTVIGPNGAGKSTLLNALMGVLPATGCIRYDGADVMHMTLEQRVMAGMALVPETRALFTTMTVEDNLMLGAWRPRQLGIGNWRDALHHVYELFSRLKERRTQTAGTLSGGERQMLALGRALMGQPRLLMLDEPSLGLAPLVVQDIFRTIEQLRSTGVTILLVEQNARAALKIADWAYVLETGSFVASGPAPSLRDDARVADIYLGARATDGP